MIERVTDSFIACTVKCRLLLLLPICLTCCMPQYIEPDRSSFKPELKAKAFMSFDGSLLSLRQWLPEGKPRAVIVALHGFNDYANFIADAAGFFSQQGLAVYAWDQRGFGHSPNRGRWPGNSAFANDLQTFVSLIRKRYPETPLFLLGESMGAAVVLHSLSENRLDVDGLILSAPAVRGWSAMPLWQRWGLRLATYTVPWSKFTGKSLKIVASDNREMLQALSRDPLIIKATRTDTIYGLVTLMEAAYQSIRCLQLPALILYGERDEVIQRQPVLETFGPLTRRNKTQRLQLYGNGYHMLLRDLQASVVWRDILTWIDHRNEQLPSQKQGLSYEFLEPLANGVVDQAQ